MKNIVLICDDAYALPTMVCIQSIMMNIDPNDFYDIHICTFGLNETNVEKFEKMSLQNISVHVHIVERLEIGNKLSQINQQTHVTTTALIKLELPNIFANLDKILYLDSDIVLKGSIHELFEVDVNDAYLAASFEYWKYHTNLQYCPRENRKDDFYFNSGVMLLNLRKMREDSIPDQLWEYKLNHTKTKLMDQECLNMVCGQAVIPLSIKWNFNPVFLLDEHLKGINVVYHEQYANIDQLLEDVHIIHYVGKEDKPWVYEAARLRQFWDNCYQAVQGIPELHLKNEPAAKRNLFVASIEKIKKYGLCGYVNFIWYRLRRMVRR